MLSAADREPVQAIRRFSRFYTQKMDLLKRKLYNSEYSLMEARVIYELANNEELTAVNISQTLDIDAGYLSRILKGFEAKGYLVKYASDLDARRILLSLTQEGRKQANVLAELSNDHVVGVIKELSPESKSELVEAMDKIEDIFMPDASRDKSFIIRPHLPGDLGWVLERHGTYYSEAFGFSEGMETFSAANILRFLNNHVENNDRCWIAEYKGERVGSIFMMKESEHVAKLRMLLVEPSARGLGVGRKLVEQCIASAHQSGYKTMTLWTYDALVTARHIYLKAGFVLTGEEKYTQFGPEVTGQTYELQL